MDINLTSELSDDILIRCFALLPLQDYSVLKSVCRRWKSILTSKQLYSYRRSSTESYCTFVMKCDAFGVIEADIFSAYSHKQKVNQTLKRGLIFDTPECNRSSSSASTFSNYERFDVFKKTTSEILTNKGFTLVALLEDVYVIGGFRKGDAIATVYIFNVIARAWRRGPPMNFPRGFSKGTSINGSIFVTGGIDSEKMDLSHCEMLSPLGESWTILPTPAIPDISTFRIPRHVGNIGLKFSVVEVATQGGKFYISYCFRRWPYIIHVGGAAYDPLSAGWTSLPEEFNFPWEGTWKVTTTLKDNIYYISFLTGGFPELHCLDESYNWRIFSQGRKKIVLTEEFSKSSLSLFSSDENLHLFFDITPF